MPYYFDYFLSPYYFRFRRIAAPPPRYALLSITLFITLYFRRYAAMMLLPLFRDGYAAPIDVSP